MQAPVRGTNVAVYSDWVVSIERVRSSTDWIRAGQPTHIPTHIQLETFRGTALREELPPQAWCGSPYSLCVETDDGWSHTSRTHPPSRRDPSSGPWHSRDSPPSLRLAV